MRLRNTIARPERFDAAAFRNKRRNPAVPLYPDLLAAQIIPFHHRQQPAAFPSLPINLTRNPNIDEENVEPGLEPDTIEQENNHQPTKVIDCVKLNELPDHVCSNCCLEVRTPWSSLPLSVQHHIFTTLMNRHKYAEIVATSLKLTDDEFEQIKHHVALRKIHQVPLEDIWSYGAEIDNLGTGVMHPDTLNTLMDYLIFASRYESASADEVERGRKFLWWLRLDSKIMDSFVLPVAEEDHEEIEIEPVSQRQSQSPSKNLSHSTNAVSEIRVPHPNEVSEKGLVHPSAPANVTISDQALRGIGVEMNSITDRKTTDHSVLPLETSQLPANYKAKDMRLAIDESGLAKLVAGDNLNQDVGDTVGSKCTLATPRAISTTPNDFPADDVLATPGNVPATPRDVSGVVQRLYAESPANAVIHKNHNPQLFAKHLMHGNFPETMRTRLLKEDPCKMNNLDHWFVYGTAWRFSAHAKTYGSVPLPADKKFNPREDILDGSSLTDASLQRLVVFQNEWVAHKAWEKKQAAELIGRFNHGADFRMERFKQYVPHPSKSGKRKSEQSSRVSVSKQKHVPKVKSPLRSSASLIMKQKRAPSTRPRRKKTGNALDSDESLLANVKGAADDGTRKPKPPISLPKHLTQDEASLPKSAFPLIIPHHTPDRTIQQHTGDTTIAILPSTVHPNQQLKQQHIKPVPFQHKPSAEIIQTVIDKSKLNYAQDPSGTSAAVLFKIDAAQLSSTQVKSTVLKAPSYSPISDQDQDSLPIWGRQDMAPNSGPSATSPTSQKSPFRMPFERTPGSSIQGNKLMQKFLDAAAEDIPNVLDVFDAYAAPSSLPLMPEVLQQAGTLNRHQTMFLSRIQQSILARNDPQSQSNASTTLENGAATVPNQNTNFAPMLLQQTKSVVNTSVQTPNLLSGVPVKNGASNLQKGYQAVEAQAPLVSNVRVDIPPRKGDFGVPSKAKDQIPAVVQSSKVAKTASNSSQSLPFTPLAPCFMSKTDPKASNEVSVTLTGRKKPGPKPKIQPNLDKATIATPAQPAVSTNSSNKTPLENTSRTTKATSGTLVTPATPATPTRKKTSSTTRARKTPNPANHTITPSIAIQTPTESTKKRRSDYGRRRAPYNLKKRKTDSGSVSPMKTQSEPKGDDDSKVMPKKDAKMGGK